MKLALPITLFMMLFFLGACTMFETKPSETSPELPQKALAVPVGENWQITEEAPNLSGDRLPFQTEKSVQPAGINSVLPTEKIEIETIR